LSIWQIAQIFDPKFVHYYLLQYSYKCGNIISEREVSKMYRITVRNTETGIKFYEYGFSRDMMKRIHFLFHETDNDGYSIYDILDITILAFSLKTFKKCLTNYTTL
jgi:hypothetical protein